MSRPFELLFTASEHTGAASYKLTGRASAHSQLAVPLHSFGAEREPNVFNGIRIIGCEIFVKKLI